MVPLSLVPVLALLYFTLALSEVLLLLELFFVVLKIPPCLLSLAKFVRQLDVFRLLAVRKDIDIFGKTTDSFQ